MLTPTFHLIGLPTDCNSSFTRGPAAAPQAIRSALWSDRGNLAAEDGQEIGHDFLLEDRGDLPLTETAGDDAIIRAAVAESLGAGAIPHARPAYAARRLIRPHPEPAYTGGCDRHNQGLSPPPIIRQGQPSKQLFAC